jgi:hypothetical protein
MTNELQRMEAGQLSAPLTAREIIGQVNLIQEVMEAVMKEGEHYGKIPGCGDKPTLLQPGAQKLLLTFRLAPSYDVQETNMERGHREYRVQCTLKSIGSGSVCGAGMGACSTMEGKYRFRVAPKKLTDRPVPKEFWELRGKDPKAAQALLGGPGFSYQKDAGGSWMIAEGSSEKVEHDNPADYYNTCLKMATKRALVAATLTATAASDIFTQDIEEMPEVVPGAAQAATQPTPTMHKAEPPKAAPAPSVAHSEPNGEVVEEAVLSSFEEKNGTSSRGPWTAWFCVMTRYNNTTFKATTFDKKIGEAIAVLAGSVCRIKHKEGKKLDQRDIVSIEPADNVPM